MDIMSLTKFCLIHAVHFGELNVILLERRRRKLIFWCESLAVATPAQVSPRLTRIREGQHTMARRIRRESVARG